MTNEEREILWRARVKLAHAHASFNEETNIDPQDKITALKRIECAMKNIQRLIDLDEKRESIRSCFLALPRAMDTTERDIRELAATGEPSAEWLLELLEAGDGTLLGMLSNRET